VNLASSGCARGSSTRRPRRRSGPGTGSTVDCQCGAIGTSHPGPSGGQVDPSGMGMARVSGECSRRRRPRCARPPGCLERRAWRAHANGQPAAGRPSSLQVQERALARIHGVDVGHRRARIQPHLRPAFRVLAGRSAARSPLTKQKKRLVARVSRTLQPDPVALPMHLDRHSATSPSGAVRRSGGPPSTRCWPRGWSAGTELGECRGVGIRQLWRLHAQCLGAHIKVIASCFAGTGRLQEQEFVVLGVQGVGHGRCPERE
jgi:hypothetical protein